jgi:formylglycine-generating enzyme required for sulfatase activity
MLCRSVMDIGESRSAHADAGYCFNPAGRTNAMSDVLKRSIPLAIAVLVLVLTENTFAQDTSKIKDIWDKADIVAKLLISFVAAAVPSLIAWQIHRYNKRQADDDAARRAHEQTIEREQRQRDLEIRRLDTVGRFMPQLMSEQNIEKFSALALIRTLGDHEFVDQISEAFMRPLVEKENRLAIEELRTNPNPNIADVAKQAFENVYSSTGPRAPPDVSAATLAVSYYEELSEKIRLDQAVSYNDGGEQYGDFVVTRGLHVLGLPTAFRMGIYLVTNEFFKMFVSAGGYDAPDYWRDGGNRGSYRTIDGTPGPGPWLSRTTISPGLEHHPVSGISFFEAGAFVLWLQRTQPPKEDGWRWALPTEDMWEYAARSADGRLYPWGSSWLPNCCNSIEAGINSTTQVNQYPTGRSAVGCFDMAGNLWEFVDAQDWDPYTCIMRGGSFRNNKGEVRSHLRLIHVPRGHRPPDFGFRIAQVFEGSQ